MGRWCARASLASTDVLETGDGHDVLQFPPRDGRRPHAFVSGWLRSFVYRGLKVTQVGDIRADIQLECVVYDKLARKDGCFTMVSWPSIYRGLNLEARYGAPHLWLQKMWPSWEKHFASLDGLAVSARSQVYKKSGVLDGPDRHLPWP